LNFPYFPLRNIENMAIPENLSKQEIQQIDTLRLDENHLNSTEKETRKQEVCTKWRDDQSYYVLQNAAENICTLLLYSQSQKPSCFHATKWDNGNSHAALFKMYKRLCVCLNHLSMVNALLVMCY